MTFFQLPNGQANRKRTFSIKNGARKQEFLHTTESINQHDLFRKEPHTSCRYQFSSVQLLSPIQLFVTPWTVAHQGSLSITNSHSLLKLMFIESVRPSNHLILCHPFSSCLQSFPESGFFQMSQFFASYRYRCRGNTCKHTAQIF